MEHSVEDIKKHVRGYWIIGGTLYVFTMITVAAKHLHLSTPKAICLALFIALIKGTLVASFFMHLISERKLIYFTLILTVIFFAVMMFLPLFQYWDVFPGITF